MTSVEPRRIARRSLLAGAVSAAAGTGVLAACGPGNRDTSPSPTSTGAAKSVPPTYLPFAGVKPDRPGTADGVSPVFYRFPMPPVQREGFPLSGSAPWRSFQQTRPTKVPPAENRAFMAMQVATGAKFEIINGLSGGDFIEKFQVLMAGGDIPDFVQILPTAARLPALLEKHFMDLTDVLGGDNVAKYPGLANIPTATWRIPTINGRLWGIPQPRPPAGYVVTSRGDTFARRGLTDPNVKLRDGSDFVDLMKQLTNKSKNEFALGADPQGYLMPLLLTMFGAPNGWRHDGGEFVHQIETEEYKLALIEAAKIVQAGYLHPNSFSEPANDDPWFRGGVTGLYVQSFVGWGANMATNPEWNVGNIELPRWSGGGLAPIQKFPAGYEKFVAIKKSDDARLDYLLRVADYSASPFGTQQYLDVNLGVEDYNYNQVGGGPVQLPLETNPGVPDLSYMGSNRFAVLYSGSDSHAGVDAQQEYLRRVIPTGIDDASQGLYSETWAARSGSMAARQNDVERAILLGQKPVSVWDDFVKSWKTTVGGAAAREYLEAKAAQ